MIELEFGQAFLLALGALAFGLILLVKGGDWTIDSSVYLAERAGMSHLAIGFTVIAFGTSLPELIVSVNANLTGSAGIALGNVLGSNIANIMFVGAAAALVAPLVATSKGLNRQIYVMLAATFLLTVLILYGEITRLVGFVMIGLLLAYIYYEYHLAKRGEITIEEIEDPQYSSAAKAFGVLIVGLSAVALGAEFMVDGAQLIASMIGIPEAVIALTIIAIGTSLPELSTCMAAMAKKHGDIVLGNLIGSNVFNILMIIGAAAIARPIMAGDFSSQIADFDVWITLGVSLVFAGLVLFSNKIGKKIGVVFLGGYAIYVIGLYSFYLIGR